MSKRLQVLFEASEYRLLLQLARRSRTSLGEWVRQALRKQIRSGSSRSPEDKLKTLRRTYRDDCPSGDIEQLLKQIEKGYLS